MKNKTLLTLLLLLTVFTASADKGKTYDIPGTQVIPIRDSVKGYQYELYIKLPGDYENDEKTSYPVIYFTDAVWHIEGLSAATAYLMENSILVGISWQKDIDEDLIKDVGKHVSRNRDYTARKSDKPERQAKFKFGQASQHLNFIRNDVIAYIEKNYRTDSAQRSYFGYSLGGEFGIYALLTQPDTFNNYILGSPSLREAGVTYFSTLASQNAAKLENLNAQVFISYGTLEQKAAVHIESFIALLKNIKSTGLSLNHPVIEGNHQTAFPLTVVRAVTWLNNSINSGEQL
ncbi:alpha/beta hydrolase [Marinicella rhabdoformis]|uniref:alpha/beta hydrolase n=1 Tax=Marinicella rhabdoformis TaxID=2580566 RepID=UPI0012AEB59F|nr:alpha/beta hydrolase-fold protein [Marinicella rhabdoformis]